MPRPPRLRPYRPSDRAACITLFESNVPEYFGAHERSDFLSCFDEDIGPYFVLDSGGQAIGCGGYAMHPEMPASVSLTWGMVRRDLHGQGLGSQLLTGRLERIRTEGRLAQVRIETTPMSAGFFARFGFIPVRTVANGFGEGYDLIEMSLALR